MARDEARAERIRSVIEQRKADDPTFTTRHIADQLNVSERAVSAWKATGALSRANSDKLAKLANVDPVILWLGRRTETPDALDIFPAGPSHQVDQGFEEFRGYVRELQDQINMNERKIDRNCEMIDRLLIAVEHLTVAVAEQAVAFTRIEDAEAQVLRELRRGGTGSS